jgi:hypothetical protein
MRAIAGVDRVEPPTRIPCRTSVGAHFPTFSEVKIARALCLRKAARAGSIFGFLTELYAMRLIPNVSSLASKKACIINPIIREIYGRHFQIFVNSDIFCRISPNTVGNGNDPDIQPDAIDGGTAKAMLNSRRPWLQAYARGLNFLNYGFGQSGRGLRTNAAAVLQRSLLRRSRH